MLPVISEFIYQCTSNPVPPLMSSSTEVRSNSPIPVAEQTSSEAGFAAGVPGETSTVMVSSSLHPCESETVTAYEPGKRLSIIPVISPLDQSNEYGGIPSCGIRSILPFGVSEHVASVTETCVSKLMGQQTPPLPQLMLISDPARSRGISVGILISPVIQTILSIPLDIR